MASTPADIGQYHDAERLLREVAHLLSAAGGGQFFPDLVLNLTRLLQVDYAFVAEFDSGQPDTLITIAFCKDGQLLSNIHYRLAPGTPCGDVGCNQVCHFPSNAQGLYPDDDLLRRHRIEAFIGHPLVDSQGRVLGLLAVMHEKPIRDQSYVESILRLCAVRTAAELQRLHAEAALHESEQRFRTLTENIHQVFWIQDVEKNRSTYVSRAYERIWGRSCESFYASPNAWLEALHPEDRATMIKKMRETPADWQGDRQEYRVIRPNGSTRWVLAHAFPIRDSAGKLRQVVGITEDITERREGEAQRLRLSSAIEQSADSVAITDRSGVIEYVNPAFESNTGFTAAEAIGNSPRIVKSSAHDDAFYRNLWETIERGKTFHGVLINRRKNGDLYYEEKTITPLRDNSGNITHFLSTGRDITQRVKAEQLAFRLGRILDQSSNEIYVFDAETLRFVQVNQGAQANLGYSVEELAGMTLLDIEATMEGGEFEALIQPLKNGKKDSISFTAWHRRKDDSRYPVDVRIQLSHAETPPVFVAIVQDVTERRHAEERLNYLAYNDTLTGLPNRVFLYEQLRRTIQETDRHGRLGAVIFLDLDRFKVINDTLGHDAGDMLLKEVAVRLTKTVRPDDTVARLGGDEFTILLSHAVHVNDITHAARRVLDSFTSPFVIGHRELFITASLGITVFPIDDSDPKNLLKNADVAMYHAKEQGRNTFQYFTAEMNARAIHRLRMESDLYRALERNELLLHYQPIVDVGSGMLIGVEALLRWVHPQTGMILPGEFIPFIEEMGLIGPVGAWVLRTACEQVKEWDAMGLSPPKVSINVSSKQLRSPAFGEQVKMILRETGISPERVNLEITESILMQNIEQAAAMLDDLNRFGISFALDDFGTGYSSMGYLKRFPIDILKIDRSFICDVLTDPDDASIVSAIITMAHSLGKKVIAEGVETQAQSDLLREQGCDYMQGYYYSRPLPAARLATLLYKKTHLTGAAAS